MQNVFCAINFPLKREVRKEVRLPFQMESACGKVYVRQRNPNGGGATVLRELNVASNAEGERYLVAKKEARYGRRRRRFSDCDQVRPYNPNGKLLGLAECCVAFVSAHLDFLESLQDFPEEMGSRIWKRALSDGNCERNLGVFADAYPNAFLPDCRISSLVLLDDRVELWPALLAHVRSLDLSDCQMGDSHELVGELYREVHVIEDYTSQTSKLRVAPPCKG